MAQFWRLWAADVVDAVRTGRVREERQAELQAIQIDNAVLVAIPAEVFTGIGTMIQSESPWPNTFLITYANGCVGYIPDEKDYQNSGYAARLAPAIYDYFPFRSDVGAVLVDGLKELMRLLR